MDNIAQESSLPSRGTWIGLTASLVLRASVNPRLALDLLSLTWAFRAHDWLRRPPFLPLPSKEYVEWRMYTAYGDTRAVPPVEDVIGFAQWRRKLLNL